MNSRIRLLLSIGIPVLLIIVVIGAFLLVQRSSASPGTTTGTNTPSSVPKSLTPMTLALDWTPNTNHTGIYVALAKGWYRDEGIALTLLPYSANVSPDTMVANGKADVGISSTESIVADYALGQPVVSISAIIQHNTSALVTLASSGLNRPRDLNGKVYGGFGAPYEGAVVGEIIKNDGGTGQFKNVTLGVDAMTALETHRVDFVWVFEGWEVIQAQLQGVKLNVFPIINYGVPDYYTPNIITSPQEMKSKSDMLRRFMAATLKGYDFARQNPRQAAQILINSAPKGTFPNPQLVYESQAYLSPRYVDQGRAWGWQDASAWTNYPQFILNSHGVDNAQGKPVHTINFNALYTNEFLPKTP